jgi:hypothetical protein
VSKSLFTKRPRLKTRAAGLLLAAVVVGVPGVALRVMCFGDSCRVAAQASSHTPYCSLPRQIRDLVQAGYHDGRSPDLIAVTGETLVSGGTAFKGSPPRPLWPTTSNIRAGRVPIVFFGPAVAAGGAVPAGTRLDAVAETLARVMDLRRDHPEVRSGEAVNGIASGRVPRLVLEIVWKGIGSDDLEQQSSSWPVLRRLMQDGAATLDGDVGALPYDPAATIATIGTGGLPYQHGIVGRLFRQDSTVNLDEGKAFGDAVVRAWSAKAPTSVIATLGDHLDEKLRQRPLIGLVATDREDRGLIGGDWYVKVDHDPVAIVDKNTSPLTVAKSGVAMLRKERFGKDEIPDLMGIVLAGPVDELDHALAQLVRAARDYSRGSFAVAVTATGSNQEETSSAISARRLSSELEARIKPKLPVIDAIVPGGIYLDQRRLARLELSDDVVLRELLTLRDDDGDRIMADAFPSIAITFGRYC